MNSLSKVSLAGLAFGCLFVATPALAQSASNNVGQRNAAMVAAMDGNRDQDRFRMESDEQRLRRETETREEAEARYGAERLALADRVQALINEGRCREAREMASEAGERSMVIRIRQTCRSRS